MNQVMQTKQTKLTLILVALVAVFTSACAPSAPPRYEGSIDPVIEVHSIEKRSVEYQGAQAKELKVSMSVSLENRFGRVDKMEQGEVTLFSTDTAPVVANGKDHSVFISASCEDQECTKVAVLITTYSAGDGIQGSPVNQLAALFEERDGVFVQIDTKRAYGEIVGASSAF